MLPTVDEVDVVLPVVGEVDVDVVLPVVGEPDVEGDEGSVVVSVPDVGTAGAGPTS